MNENYIELLTPGDHPALAYLNEYLADREGFAALAARTFDIEGSIAALRKERLTVGDPLRFSRPVPTANGSAEARFTVAMMDPAMTPGGQMFICQHHTPELIWSPDRPPHPNGAMRFISVHYAAANVSGPGRAFEKMFDAVAKGRTHQALEITTGGASIFVMPAAEIAARFPGTISGAPAPGFAALQIHVEDVAATAALLTANGVPFSDASPMRLLVGADHANGLVIEFYEV